MFVHISHGHYYDDYPTAKEDFVERSRLVNIYKLFTDEQLNLISQAVDYCLEEECALASQYNEDLCDINRQISYALEYSGFHLESDEQIQGMGM